ncbi:pantoate--beta-alanine ligase [Pseudidiomarina mangrovi]|uniref:pantoate--beta-alanine ligase n=1 Tax=Pseudidiomarina mangrovi TaxID=2487133 RepID=UPI000FCB795C|nr:pantoate--beta-alanine ligase [Pseudidiomarina mangrovi]CAI8162302.1 MAG: Pantothenate synthetase [Pseudidiomarina mangrovi]
MQVLKSLEELRAWRKQLKGSLAFVPTMGNLHEGHLKLVDLGRQRADAVIVSIFVNPLQFGANEDLDSYPRTFAADCQALVERGAAAVFAPTVADMYPRGLAQQSYIEVPDISDILCGASRPGHFRGVATIVAKLFNMVQPDLAIFGEKDYQQLQVIRLMSKDLSLPVKVIGMPTERAADGLALSSRNGYLTATERQQAPLIYATLQTIAAQLKAGSAIESAVAEATERLQQGGFRIDYLSVRRRNDMAEASSNDNELVIVVAAYLGKTRLIDNLQVTR